MFNESFRPFWNKSAPDLWDQLQAKFAGDPTKRAPGVPAPAKVKVDDLFSPIGDYRFDFGEAVKPVKARYDSFEKDEASPQRAVAG